MTIFSPTTGVLDTIPFMDNTTEQSTTTKKKSTTSVAVTSPKVKFVSTIAPRFTKWRTTTKRTRVYYTVRSTYYTRQQDNNGFIPTPIPSIETSQKTLTNTTSLLNAAIDSLVSPRVHVQAKRDNITFDEFLGEFAFVIKDWVIGSVNTSFENNHNETEDSDNDFESFVGGEKGWTSTFVDWASKTLGKLCCIYCLVQPFHSYNL